MDRQLKHQLTATQADDQQSVILLIDDDEDQLLIFQTLLRQSSANVITARSALEGLKLIENTRVDLVICDVFMKPVSGFDFVEKIRETHNHSELPVIAVSAMSTDLEETVLATGATSYCSKTKARNLLSQTRTLLQ